MPPQIVIEPKSALIDEPLDIRLSDFEPASRITLKAAMTDDAGQTWRSAATFVTDTDGRVNVGAQTPSAGSYDIADAMGLVWSMQAETLKSHPTMFIQNKLTPLTIDLTAEVDGQVVAQTSGERVRLAEGITRTILRERGLFGTFFQPPGSGSHPAVMLVSGSGGGINEGQAALYAAHGYAALTLAYFNYESLPEKLVEIPLEYFETAIAWLQAQEHVDSDRLVVSGGSRGGELSLLLGSRYPQIRAVVAFVPSGVIWGGIGPAGADMRTAAWTYQGQALPFIPAVDIARMPELYEAFEQTNDPIPLAPGYRANFAAASNLDAATIPVENINGSVLLISGEDDRMSPSATFSEQIIERLTRSRFPHTYKHYGYKGAGHLIRTPYVPTTTLAFYHPIRHRAMAFGGSPKDNAHANGDSWSRVLHFLETELG